MVDWDRVEQLRSTGASWNEIAADPRVDFPAEASADDAGRALHALYRRNQGPEGEATGPPRGAAKPQAERRWTLARVGYLLVPLFAVWFTVAYLVPSPVGVVVPAIPYLALASAGAAFVLVYGLWRATEGRRWTKVYRNTMVVGVAVGSVVAGLIGLSGGTILGCPYLPPSSSLRSTIQGWSTVPTSPWKDGGRPVLFFYGGTWCPYCSASSWAVWKALTEYGTVSGNFTAYSFPSPEPYAYTPEMVLASVHLSSPAIAAQVNEYAGSVDGRLDGTANCSQQAYVTAYDLCSTCGVPFLVINGQYLHIGTLYSPHNLSAWNRTNNASGAAYVADSVRSESGRPWLTVRNQSWAIMAFLARSTGESVPALATTFGWSPTTMSGVWADVNRTLLA
ncbi:MAG TPA: DUF929 family protein [Thermoplasmata archaeon]|nr:DUF929 family protein [Thermoplasmata archaeon]